MARSLKCFYRTSPPPAGDSSFATTPPPLRRDPTGRQLGGGTHGHTRPLAESTGECPPHPPPLSPARVAQSKEALEL